VCVCVCVCARARTCIAGQLDLVSDFNELHSVVLKVQALLGISNEVHPFHKPVQKKNTTYTVTVTLKQEKAN